MNMPKLSRTIFGAFAAALAAGPALAGASTIPVPEPGIGGLFAGAAVLAIALASRSRNKSDRK